MKMILGVTVAMLLGMGFVAVPAQAYLVGGDSCPSCEGSVYELTLAPFGARAYQAFLSSDRYGFSSPSAFLHIGAGTSTDTEDRASAGGGSGVPRGHADVSFAPPPGIAPAQSGYPWAGEVFPPTGFQTSPGLIHAQPSAITPSAAPVPEPSTLPLLGSGLAGLGAVLWRRHRRG